ncbi:cytidylate kinase-like family protein [Christensenellaceae bacterium NSJ-44]|uniref:Cytidylate kinase-like family protein n=1 Tax=Luoshenia tenuis TaxID=2763654 RepID=A0A926CZN4_9FIRM|nr:cytidylate kinase-like family protein [Luoshenia tenuis]MBC8529690.1 cytidylate kinase-like family protein [Luoshenia tenuis]SCI65933.1 cytidylate kinase [uncultured Clostridium sp.]
MYQQLIVTIGREFGSGGHYIAEKLSERLDLPLFDKKILEHVGYSQEDIHKYDEKPGNPLLSRRVGRFSNSIEEVLAERTFDFIRELAEKGESFVVVGRCAEQVLRENPNAYSIFVLADEATKVKRIAELYTLTERKALELMRKQDRRRKYYHNTHSDIKWGDSRGYDLCINSSTLGVDKTVEAILQFLALRKDK